jgi:hypothetical protein
MAYLRSCWAALVPPAKEAPAPQYGDLEAYGGADAADVCVQVSPLLRATDIHRAMDV